MYIYHPHVWSPNTQFTHEFLKQIEQQKASHLIPGVYTDLEASQYYRAGRETRLELALHLARAIKAVADKKEDHAILAKVVEGIFEGFAENYGRQRFKPTAIGNVQLFVNLIFILYARWRLKIKLASLAIRKNLISIYF